MADTSFITGTARAVGVQVPPGLEPNLPANQLFSSPDVEVWPPPTSTTTSATSSTAYPTLITTNPDPRSPLATSTRPTVRTRSFSSSIVKFQVDVPTSAVIPGHTIEIVAQELYGDVDQWYRIADSSPVYHPAEWQLGMTLRVPTTSNSTTSPKASVQGVPQLPGAVNAS